MVPGRLKLPVWAGMVCIALVLSGCGFRPLYGTDSAGASAADELAQIQLTTPNNRIDYLVRSHLQKVLRTGQTATPAKFDLSVRLTEQTEQVAIEEDTSITRFKLRLFGSFELRDLSTGDILYSDTSRSITAYNVVESQFATRAALRDAEARAAQDLGDDIKLRLSLYFDRVLRPGRLDPEDFEPNPEESES